MKWRLIEEKLFIGISAVACLITAMMLILIIGEIFLRGLPSLSINFIINSESNTEGLGGAIGNAIIGTIYLSVLSVIIATPFAIGTAIYLKEYASDSVFKQIFRFLIEVLSGTPSIVLGIFGLLIIVVALKPITGGFSLISGAIALAILIMPLIEKATEDAMSNVPKEIEHGSYALGSTKWETISKIIIPYSMSGIATGVVLGIGRAAEESAVVLLTAGYSQFFPEFAIKHNEKLLFDTKIYPLQDLVGTLPLSIYHSFELMGKIPLSDTFATAFVLIVIVMLINMLARLILYSPKIFKAIRFRHFGRPAPSIAMSESAGREIFTQRQRAANIQVRSLDVNADIATDGGDVFQPRNMLPASGEDENLHVTNMQPMLAVDYEQPSNIPDADPSVSDSLPLETDHEMLDIASSSGDNPLKKTKT